MQESAQSSAYHITNDKETISFLTTALAERTTQVVRWQEQYADLEKEHREMVEKAKRLFANYQNFASWEYYEARCAYVFDTVIQPYAQSKGLEFDGSTRESIDRVMVPFLYDAMEAQILRDQLHNLESQTEVIKHELLASRNQCQWLEEKTLAQHTELQDLGKNLKISQGETQHSQNQMQALQKEMLASVSKVQAISDETFSRDFCALASMVKSLGRSVRPSQDVEVANVLEPWEFLFGVEKHQWGTRARKKAFVEAWIWGVLINVVFWHPFAFFGEKTEHIQDTWTLIFGKECIDDWPDPSTDCDAWRYNTVKNLVKQIGQATIIEGQTDEEHMHAEGEIRDLQESVLRVRDRTADVIKGNLTAVSPTADLTQVPDIVNQAFTLAMNMSLQRCRLMVGYPKIGAEFDIDSMTPVPDRDGYDTGEGVVAFIVNPGLTKWGDAKGNHFDNWHEIVPSLVQLKPR
jgi:hypothetical protein